MPKRLLQLEGRPLFDLVSFGSQGSTRRDRLSPSDVEQITLTVRRAPEVMVKILTRGGQNLKAIGRHLSYLNRGGELDVETDDGEKLKGQGIESELLSGWDLDMEEDRRRSKLGPREDRRPPKLVHKLLFSMPPRTPPLKVLQAARNFAREEFGLQHRYAMVLHTDEPHPHVHMVVKAISDQGQRLNIRKATLRLWRAEFARQLRELGVPANATERAVRGEVRRSNKDGIYRANLRGDSTHMRERVETVARDLPQSSARVEPGKTKLIETRDNVRHAWWRVSEILDRNQQSDLAAEVRRFAQQMPPALTERERLAGKLLERVRPPRAREGPTH